MIKKILILFVFILWVLNYSKAYTIEESEIDMSWLRKQDCWNWDCNYWYRYERDKTKWQNYWNNFFWFQYYRYSSSDPCYSNLLSYIDWNSSSYDKEVSCWKVGQETSIFSIYRQSDWNYFNYWIIQWNRTVYSRLLWKDFSKDSWLDWEKFQNWNSDLHLMYYSWSVYYSFKDWNNNYYKGFKIDFSSTTPGLEVVEFCDYTNLKIWTWDNDCLNLWNDIILDSNIQANLSLTIDNKLILWREWWVVIIPDYYYSQVWKKSYFIDMYNINYIWAWYSKNQDSLIIPYSNDWILPYNSVLLKDWKLHDLVSQLVFPNWNEDDLILNEDDLYIVSNLETWYNEWYNFDFNNYKLTKSTFPKPIYSWTNEDWTDKLVDLDFTKMPIKEYQISNSDIGDSLNIDNWNWDNTGDSWSENWNNTYSWTNIIIQAPVLNSTWNWVWLQKVFEKQDPVNNSKFLFDYYYSSLISTDICWYDYNKPFQFRKINFDYDLIDYKENLDKIYYNPLLYSWNYAVWNWLFIPIHSSFVSNISNQNTYFLYNSDYIVKNYIWNWPDSNWDYFSTFILDLYRWWYINKWKYSASILSTWDVVKLRNFIWYYLKDNWKIGLLNLQPIWTWSFVLTSNFEATRSDYLDHEENYKNSFKCFSQVDNWVYWFTGSCPVPVNNELVNNIIWTWWKYTSLNIFWLEIDPLSQFVCTINILGYWVFPTPTQFDFLPSFNSWNNVIPASWWWDKQIDYSVRTWDVIAFMLLFIIYLTYILRLWPWKED